MGKEGRKEGRKTFETIAWKKRKCWLSDQDQTVHDMFIFYVINLLFATQSSFNGPEREVLKKSWEEVKILITSIFSFSFYHRKMPF